MNAKDLSLEDIHVGDTASIVRTWTDDDMKAFAKLSGDENPLHTDEEYAKSTQFGKRVVYGALLNTLFSQVIGMQLPGKKCLYLNQATSFKKPIFIGDTVEARVTVTAKSDVTRVLALDTVITKEGEIVAQGQAHVQVLGDN